ncbi:MAG: hypothetical protein FJ399_03140, partial [Verrucomicrobia bacterium]|nr:hypothetical protein [Verrucomicrobiota bacterium]
MTAGLGGIRAACFYPWNPFEPTGAWSRFTCLWRYLLEEGAGVTLAFLDKGKDADLRGISVRFAGQSVYGDNPHTITRAIARVLSAAE